MSTRPGPLEGATRPPADVPALEASVEGAHRPDPTKERPDLQHKAHAPRSVTFMVITVSDSRGPDNDRSGDVIHRLVAEAGHDVALYRVVKDDADAVERAVVEGLEHEAVQIVVLNGGTGVSRRDGTCEVVARMLDKRIDGFGEIFRALSYQQVGSAAMLSRAVGGICRGKAVFSMPGSPKAVELAMQSLILPEAGHLIFETRR